MSAFSKMFLAFSLIFFSLPSSGEDNFPLEPHTLFEKVFAFGLEGTVTVMAVHHEEASGKMYQNGEVVPCDDNGNCAVDPEHPHCLFMASGEHGEHLTLTGASFPDHRAHPHSSPAQDRVARSLKDRAKMIEAMMEEGAEGIPLWDPATILFTTNEAPHPTESKFKLTFDHGVLECGHPLGLVMMAEDIHHLSGGALQLH